MLVLPEAWNCRLLYYQWSALAARPKVPGCGDMDRLIANGGVSRRQ